MQHERALHFWVGFFVLLAFAAFVFLAIRVSGLSFTSAGSAGYDVIARFDNIGGLKVRSPVTVAGVKVGSVQDIKLDLQSYKAVVRLHLFKPNIPIDSTARILTEGLLGSNYIGITPGYEEEYLKSGSSIDHTTPAIILENLIGQLIFNMNKKDKK